MLCRENLQLVRQYNSGKSGTLHQLYTPKTMRLSSSSTFVSTHGVAAATAAAVLYCGLATLVVVLVATSVEGATAVCEGICDFPLPLADNADAPLPYSCSQAIDDYDIWGDCCVLKVTVNNNITTGCSFVTTTSCNIQPKGADGCVEYDVDGNCLAAVIPYTQYSATLDGDGETATDCPQSDIEIPPYTPADVTETPVLENTTNAPTTSAPTTSTPTTSTPTTAPTTEPPTPSPSSAATTTTTIILPGFKIGTAATTAGVGSCLLLIVVTCMLWNWNVPSNIDSDVFIKKPCFFFNFLLKKIGQEKIRKLHIN